jgi:hypothetical protein
MFLSIWTDDGYAFVGRFGERKNLVGKKKKTKIIKTNKDNKQTNKKKKKDLHKN